MNVSKKTKNPFRLTFRLCLLAGWLSFAILPALASYVTTPDRDALPFVKTFYQASLSFAVEDWWFSVPLLALTVWEFIRSIKN
jgi:hypothetical protein